MDVIGVRKGVGTQISKAALSIPVLPVPDDALDTDELRVLHQPVGDRVTKAVVGVARFSRHHKVNRTADGVHRQFGYAHRGTVLTAAIEAAGGEIGESPSDVSIEFDRSCVGW